MSMTTSAPFDVNRIRSDFPILSTAVHGKPIVYLDNAATAQKPLPVIEALDRYYRQDNANVHRGVHALSERATAAYEGARRKVAAFIGAGDERQIVFTRGTTEGINLVMQTFGRQHVQAGDEVLITELEHHSNIVPWQMLCEAVDARLVVAPINERGEVELDAFAARLSERTRLVAIAHVSNALGTILPVRAMVDAAHARGATVLVDGAQAMPHMPVDVQELGCDFYVFSGHKMFGPTGIGALYGRLELLEAMPPFMGGGDMILSVSFEKTVYNKVPHKFEAGTPSIAEAVALGVTIDYLNGIGMDLIAEYEHELLEYATGAVAQVPGVRLIGTAARKAGVVSFTVGTIHPHDLGTILDQEGVAIRAGHHCAQPVMEHFGVPATARASLAMYNTRDDVDRLVTALRKAQEMFGS